MANRCKVCKWLYEEKGILGHLECRRYPPTIYCRVGLISIVQTQYPRVEEDFWCGEFEKEETTETSR
jgi:hypothetical protein